VASEFSLRSDCDQDYNHKSISRAKPRSLRGFRSALGRTRTCDLLIRSHSPLLTRADTVGQGETQQRFYQSFGVPERTGRDRGRHPVAVRLRSKRVQCKPHAWAPDCGGCGCAFQTSLGLRQPSTAVCKDIPRRSLFDSGYLLQRGMVRSSFS
jgi:hypothetical protein